MEMDLVEKVARGICTVACGDPDDKCGDDNAPLWASFDGEARAALRIALEEAAMVAKVQWLKSDHGTLGDADYGCAICEEAAAAILSLLPEEPTR
jgi:hypothetical protein